MKNTNLVEQSDLNRIKYLAKDGSLAEAIKTIIPKRKHQEIKQLVEIQRNRYKEYMKRQRALIDG